MQRSNLLIHIGAILVVVAWGSSFVMTKVLLDNGLGPAQAYVYRALMAYLLMLIMSHSTWVARSAKDEFLIALCGVCSGSIYFLAENTALEYTLVSNVSLITTTSPLLTILLVALVYRSVKITAPLMIGSVVALVGVALVIFNSSLELNVKPLGDFLALAASLSWAIYSVVLRRLNASYDVTFITRKMFFYGLITAIPFLFIKGEGLELSALTVPAVWANLLGLGVVCSVLAFVIWGIAIKKLGAITTSNYIYFQPIVTLILSAIILHERITVVGLSGCALILLGVVISEKVNIPSPRRSR